jgi:transcription antitermination factor NusG
VTKAAPMQQTDRWYAIRTVPGSQKPQREFAVEVTKSSKGYRIVPSLNPDVSAIERALTDAGIHHFMPAERRLIRDRLRPYLWKSRRFALIVGYMFVREPDWYKLSKTPGVAGVVGIEGKPTPVDFLDMLKLFDAEQRCAIEFQEQSRSARQTIRKAAKTDPSLQKIVDKLDIAGTITVPMDAAARLMAA